MIATWLLVAAALVPGVAAAELPNPQKGPSGAEKTSAGAKQDSAPLDPRAGQPDAQPGTVYLSKSVRWTLSAGKRKQHQGQLAREIVRQALLIAAREELGLTTRDAWLGDPMPSARDNAPLDLEATPGEPSRVTILRGSGPNRAAIGHHDLDVAAGLDYRKLVVDMEGLSRREFVAALKQAGFAGKPNPLRTDLAVPEQIEKLLTEMTFTSQFQALRELHKTVRAQGESPALLGALVRGYANLGMLTEFHWYPAHKVFKARALLYAQRMLARRPDSRWAGWHRAYAFALAGLHQWALADLQAAAQQQEAAPEKDGTQPPPWVALIGAHCRYEISGLDPNKTDPACRQLAHLLAFNSLRLSQSGRGALEEALTALQSMPECYRLHEGACERGDVGIGHSVTLTGLMTAGQRLYARLAAMPDLPEDVRKIVRQRNAGGGVLGRLLGSGEMSVEDELKLRRRLVAALLETGKPAAGQSAAPSAPGEKAAARQGETQSDKLDVGEPSIAALGHLIQEMSFVQVWRRLQFERYRLNTSPDEFLAIAAPLVADHPYRPFIESFAWDPKARDEALRRLAKVDTEGLELNGRYLFDALYQSNRPRREEMASGVMNRGDEVTADRLMMCLVLHGPWRVQMAREVLDASPYSPAAKAYLVEEDWKEVAERAADWEKEGAQHPRLLMSLGWRYLQLGRYADAERCLKAAVEVSHSEQAYRRLAEVYRRQDQIDRWLATLEELLKQPDYGLVHAGVRGTIAKYFMSRKEWKKALPYAEQAAESYSAAALLAAADCHEGLQQWQQAEAYTRATALRYRGSELVWYFFCKRTGEGDLDAARQLADRHVKNVDRTEFYADLFSVGVFYILEKQPEKALDVFEQEFAKNGNPYMGLHLALLADQLKDAQKRDAALRRISTEGPKYNRIATGKPRQELIALAALLAKDLAKGGKGEIDLDDADKLRSTGDDAERMNYNYFLAKYLSLHGKTDQAVDYWKQCMTHTSEYGNMHLPDRTLAGAELLRRGITPADYRAALQTTPEASPRKQH
jgi:tetratricopeptide (TPR) repeat protein